MVLVTRDRHFHEVEDLLTADWAFADASRQITCDITFDAG
jgi:hypothetical protein